MAIHVLLQTAHAFTPEEVAVLVTAYESALAKLRLAAREDPATLLVAKQVITLALKGERDPSRLCDQAVEQFLGPPSAARTRTNEAFERLLDPKARERLINGVMDRWKLTRAEAEQQLRLAGL